MTRLDDSAFAGPPMVAKCDDIGPLHANYRKGMSRPRCNRVHGHQGDHSLLDVETFDVLVRWPR